MSRSWLVLVKCDRSVSITGLVSSRHWHTILTVYILRQYVHAKTISQMIKELNVYNNFEVIRQAICQWFLHMPVSFAKTIGVFAHVVIWFNTFLYKLLQRSRSGYKALKVLMKQRVHTISFAFNFRMTMVHSYLTFITTRGSELGRKKNKKGHAAHIIVSWHNPKQWIIVHTSDLIMIIR